METEILLEIRTSDNKTLSEFDGCFTQQTKLADGERPTSPSGEGKGDTMQLWFLLKLQKKLCMQEDI